METHHLTRRVPGGHWLVFDERRHVTGCHCGFQADEEEGGYGDSVLDHIQAVVEREVRLLIAAHIDVIDVSDVDGRPRDPKSVQIDATRAARGSHA